MPLAVLMMLAAAQVTPTTPIQVTGHAWAPFISPMGEPFRAKTVSDDTLADWFYQADRNRDGVLTVDEMTADAARFFATLDTNHDGEIDPDEIAHYEWEVAPDIQVMSKRLRAPGEAAAKPQPPQGEHEHERGPGHGRPGRAEDDDAQLGLAGSLQGAARYGLLNIPEPVAAADTDFDRGITLAEFKAAAIERFQLLDTGHTGKIGLAQLEALRSTVLAAAKRSKRDEKASDTRVGNSLPKSD